MPSIRKELRVMHLKSSIPVKTDEDFLNKVKYLCNKINDEEWSGVLYYQVEGSVSDLNNFTITLKDICPMNKGNSVHTAFEYGEDIIDYQMSNPVLNITPKGLIHSHNKMGVFFSKEDQEEIEDNAEFYNYYLSVVVNNRLEFAMRLSFLGSVAIYGKDEKGNSYTMNDAEQVLFVYPCHLVSTEVILPVGDIFKERVTSILKKFEVEKAEKAAKLKQNAPQLPAVNRQFDNTVFHTPKGQMKVADIVKDPEDDDSEPDERDIESFVVAILLSQFGEKVCVPAIERGDTIGDALSFIDKFFKRNSVDIHDFCAKLIETFFTLHFNTYGESTFEDIMTDFDDIEIFLTDYIGEFDFVEAIITALTQLAFNYEILEINEKQ